MEAAGRPARDVDAALRINTQRSHQPVDSPDSQLGVVGERRPQVRRAYGRQAENSPLPFGVS